MHVLDQPGWRSRRDAPISGQEGTKTYRHTQIHMFNRQNNSTPTPFNINYTQVTIANAIMVNNRSTVMEYFVNHTKVSFQNPCEIYRLRMADLGEHRYTPPSATEQGGHRGRVDSDTPDHQLHSPQKQLGKS